MSPYDGEPIRNFDDSPEAIAATARNFAGGEAAVEEGESRLAHRHADPLTHAIRPEAAALLARGAF